MTTHRYAIAPTARLAQAAVDDVIADARRLLTAARMIVARLSALNTGRPGERSINSSSANVPSRYRLSAGLLTTVP
jgi:hypothetical protein